jgi:hypothetical protein
MRYVTSPRAHPGLCILTDHEYQGLRSFDSEREFDDGFGPYNKETSKEPFMRLGIILVSAAAMVVVACSVKSENNRQSLSYDFTFNGCKTGHHEFGSVSELCAGLADETRNHGCAYNSRVEMAKAHGCPQVTGIEFARSLASKHLP